MKPHDYLKEMTVLLAEDDKSVRESTMKALEVFVARVVAVEDGAAALRHFNSGVVDIAILDIEMPQKSGLEVAREIRSRDEITPIFIISAFNDSEHLHQAIPLLLVDYLIKPLTFEQLKNALLKSVDYLDKRGGLTYAIGKEASYNKRSGTLVSVDGQETFLPKREKLLLDLLIKNRNKLLTKELLEDLIFNLDCTETSLKNLVYRLKKKLPADLIVNVRDIGYMFVDEK